MAEVKDFLVEIGTEELPPKALTSLIDAFAHSLQQQLTGLELGYTALHAYATPRRLAVRIDGLQTAQPDKIVERRGPPLKIAFDADGKPTKAAEKFAENCGIDPGEIKTIKTDKGEWLFYTGMEAGQQTADLLPGCVQQALSSLPIPKRMRWGDLDVEFVRPVHWAIMLWGEDVIATDLIGMVTGNTTYGHRFHAPQAITINRPAEYPDKLKEDGWVIADPVERRDLISEMVAAAAKSCGGEVVSDDALLDEVAALVEWPVPVAGEFDQRFLQLPPEVLISTLKDHQRYFPVVKNAAQADSILPWFVTVSNISSEDPQQVKKGNERVVAP
ncbi:MAG: glycine--tRNA ligase subunit beta, partial [Gammaproteobacteria bacterium]|nr:glycine--tRNA ligase subunit beta [Gammaproteobacteria bacterium]